MTPKIAKAAPAKVEPKSPTPRAPKSQPVKFDNYDLAIANISQFGDTDIFPFPIENAMFYDASASVKELLQSIDKNFDEYIQGYPVEKVSTCVPVGIGGFRWATQIDPIWNAYLLYLVLSVSESIEKSRQPKERGAIHSYRVDLHSAFPKIFDQKYNWRSFVGKTLELSEVPENKFVVKLDIGDFYTRIYHHRLENALTRVSRNTDYNKRIMKILMAVSSNASYGLPIGGNASRILAELLLTSIDSQLSTKKITFVRFVDDFVIFAKSREDAFSHLNFVAEFLLKNEGLSIQKTKTQILTSSEYVSQTKNFLDGDDDSKSKKRAAFMRLHINYDPYSMNANAEYEALKETLYKFDVLKLLKDELKKTKIHQAMGKQLLGAISHLEGEKLGLALQAISSNMESFYPILPSLFQMATKSIDRAPEEYQNNFILSVCRLIDANSYLLQSENNAAYAARLLSHSKLEEAAQAIDKLYSERSSILVRTNCLYAMINKNETYWLSDKKGSFQTLSSPEKRAFVAASYFLGDEGKHWRDHVKKQLSDLEKLMIEWVSKKGINTAKGWSLPL